MWRSSAFFSVSSAIGSVSLSLLVLVGHLPSVHNAGVDNCPLPAARALVVRAAAAAPGEAVVQMQLMRRLLEDVFGGSWGVLIVRRADLVATDVHWTIPDRRLSLSGPAAFCLLRLGRWQYNVFQTDPRDPPTRVSVTDLVERVKGGGVESVGKSKPVKMSITEFDARVAQALRESHVMHPVGGRNIR